jgi:ActR/RegA family two-component response regulator
LKWEEVQAQFCTASSVIDAARILGVDRQTLSNLLNARSGNAA